MDWEGEVRDNPDDPDLLQGHAHAHGHGGGDEDENKERCVICLMALRDRTIVGVCGHEFCVSRSLTFLFCLVCVTRKVELTASLNVLGYGQINLVNAHYVQPKWPLSCYTTWIVVSQQRFVHPLTCSSIQRETSSKLNLVLPPTTTPAQITLFLASWSIKADDWKMAETPSRYGRTGLSSRKAGGDIQE